MSTRPTPRAVLAPTLSLVAITIGAALSGCGIAHPPADAATSTIERLGAVPIPPDTGPPGPLPAEPGKPVLLAIGAPVKATLPEGSAIVTALGPQLDLPPQTPLPLEHAQATITVHASTSTGRIPLLPADFTARDDHGRAIPLTADTTDGDTATLRLTGDFHSGSAQITWRRDSSVVALWAFVIELD